MTDREKLIELLCKAHSKAIDEILSVDISYAQQLEIEADYLLANGVTIQKWIPVSERLPEKWREQDNEYFGDEIEFIVHIKGAQCATFLCFDGEQFYDQTTGEIYSVTHWMPLPNPPEEEK